MPWASVNFKLCKVQATYCYQTNCKYLLNKCQGVTVSAVLNMHITHFYIICLFNVSHEVISGFLPVNSNRWVYLVSC